MQLIPLKRQAFLFQFLANEALDFFCEFNCLFYFLHRGEIELVTISSLAILRSFSAFVIQSRTASSFIYWITVLSCFETLLLQLVSDEIPNLFHQSNSILRFLKGWENHSVIAHAYGVIGKVLSSPRYQYPKPRVNLGASFYQLRNIMCSRVLLAMKDKKSLQVFLTALLHVEAYGIP